MRVTSPPKHLFEIKKAASPLNKKNNKNFEHPIHHLNFSSPIKVSQKIQANNSLKQNLYAELRNRQHEYVELIKDLHKENKLLKAELGKLHYEESHKLYDSTPLSQNRFINTQPSNNVLNGLNAFRMMSNENFNKTLPSFPSPQRMNLQKDLQMRSYQSPLSRKPSAINISPDAFRARQDPITPVGVRPVSNLMPKPPLNKTIDGSCNQFKQPQITISKPSHKQSSECSPRKNFQIVHVVEATLKLSASKITKKQAQQHLNPLTSKRQTVTKSCRSQLPQYEQIHPQNQQQLNSEHLQFNLEKNIDNNPLLNMLKKRLQQETNFLSSKSECQEKKIEESKCGSFLKTSQYNQNIRYSNDNGHDQAQGCHVIFPLTRNIFHQFPILNKLRMAQSEIQDQSETYACQIHPPAEEILQKNTQKSQQSSRLSEKISKEAENQSFVEEVYTSKNKALTIIKMLEENRKNEQQSKSIFDQDNFESRQQMELEVQPSQPEYFEVNFIGMEKQTRKNIEDGFEKNQVSAQFYGNTQNNQKGQIHHNLYSNRYYYQKTEQDQNEDEKSHNTQFRRSNEEKLSNFFVEMTQKASISQSQKIVITQSSQKIIVSPCLNSHQAEHKTQYTDQRDKVLQKAQSLEFNDEDSMSQQNSRVTQQQKPKLTETSQYQRFYGNKIEPNKNPSAISSNRFPMNKTTPNFRQQQQNEFSQLKDLKHIDNLQKYSLTENNWSSDSLRSHRFKKISNMAYL